MIKIIMLSGPFEGEEKEIRDGDVDPLDLITKLASYDWKWVLDFSEASEEETFEWIWADLIGRILAALQHGRTVHFLGTEYRVDMSRIEQSLPEIAGRVEDAIAYSGLHVRIESDNEEGVVIGVAGTEHQIQ